MRRTLGIDEAGRGPALGPMVLACVVVDTASARRLARAGVADSKRFGAGPDAHQARQELAVVIRKHALFFAHEVCDVPTIDRYVAWGGLNRLEQECAARLIAKAPKSDRLIADGARLFAPLVSQFPNLEARNRAEAVHVAVAAASVLAKVERDDQFARIAARYAESYGPLAGGGYVNPPTMAFVRWHLDRFGQLPLEARTSWTWPWSREASLQAGDAKPRPL